MTGRSIYASTRRYEVLKKDRDYWKDRALRQNDASYKDGLFSGAVIALVCVFVLGITLLLIFG